jgi:histidine ammonia-lyase
MKETGINSGFMILQYTSAALASECKTMCFPASADSIPTSLGQEDHVSMGSISGRKALQVICNVEKILAIELICAVQALDFHRPLLSTHLIMSIRDKVRETIPFMTQDDIMYEHIESAIALINSGTLLKLVNLPAHV